MKKSRNDLLDIAKGIAIVLVTIGHTWWILQGNHWLFLLIFSCHIPFFFFVSGIFIREKTNARVFFLSRINQLLRPYFSSAVIFFIFYRFYAWHKGGAGDIGLIDIYDFATNTLTASRYSIDPHWIHLWFLPCLAATTLVSYFILKLREYFFPDFSEFNLALINLALLLFYLFFWPIKLSNSTAWSLDILPITVFYALAGHLFRDRVLNLKFNYKRLLILCFTFVLFIYACDSKIDLNNRVFNFPVVCLIESFLGIALICYLGLIFKENSICKKVFAYLGRRSLFIYIFHFTANAILFPQLIVFVSSDKILASIIAAFISIVLSLILSEVILRYGLISRFFTENTAKS